MWIVHITPIFNFTFSIFNFQFYISPYPYRV